MSALLSVSQRARIAWISANEGPGPVHRKAFREAGYVISDLKDERFADIAIVDFRDAPVSAKTARKLSTIARRSAPHGGIIYLSDELLDPSRRSYLRRSGSLVTMTDDATPLIAACRERLRERNLAEEAGERIKSLTECGALKPLKSPVKDRGLLRALVAGKPSPLTLSVLTILRQAGYYVEGALSSSQAMTAIETNTFDCAVFLPSTLSDPLRSLAASCKRRNRETDMPVLLITDDPVSGHDLITADQVEHDLCPLVKEATARSRQARLLRRLLSGDGQRAVIDPHTSAVTANFFARHATRLIAQATETERPLSLLTVGLTAEVFKDVSALDIAEPLADMTALIMNVSRTEDMLARIAPTTFVLTMPATTVEDAARVGERMTGVLQNTMFKMHGPIVGEETLFAVMAQACAIGAEPGARLEELVAKMLSALKENTQPQQIARIR